MSKAAEEYALLINHAGEWERCGKGTPEYLLELLNDYATSCDSFIDCGAKFKLIPFSSTNQTNTEKSRRNARLKCFKCPFEEQFLQTLIESAEPRLPHSCLHCGKY